MASKKPAPKPAPKPASKKAPAKQSAAKKSAAKKSAAKKSAAKKSAAKKKPAAKKSAAKKKPATKKPAPKKKAAPPKLAGRKSKAKKPKPKAAPVRQAGRFLKLPADDELVLVRARAWQPPWGDLFLNNHFLAEFLGRLWSLFGEPTEKSDAGYEYLLLDQETGAVVSALQGDAAPTFGAEPGVLEGDAAVNALEALVNDAVPVDCSVRYQSAYGPVELGYVAGAPFLLFDVDADA